MDYLYRESKAPPPSSLNSGTFGQHQNPCRQYLTNVLQYGFRALYRQTVITEQLYSPILPTGALVLAGGVGTWWGCFALYIYSCLLLYGYEYRILLYTQYTVFPNSTMCVAISRLAPTPLICSLTILDASTDLESRHDPQKKD